MEANGLPVPHGPEPGGALSAGPPHTGSSGPGPVRVLLLGLVAAMVIGSTGYAVSVALDPEPGFSQTMCVDSTCTYAMSAGMPMAGHMSQRPTPAKKPSGPERLVRNALSFLHLR